MKKAMEKCGNCKFYKGDGNLCRRFPEHVDTGKTRWCGEWVGKYDLEAMESSDAHVLVNLHKELHREHLNKPVPGRRPDEVASAQELLDMDGMGLDVASDLVRKYFEHTPQWWADKSLYRMKHIVKAYTNGDLKMEEDAPRGETLETFLNTQQLLNGHRPDYESYEEYAAEAWEKLHVRTTYDQWVQG